LRKLLPLQITRSPDGRCRIWALPLLCAGTALAWSGPLHAQTTTGTYFPTGTSGYDQDLGVTVLSRIRPEYQAQGVQLGGFTINPELDQSIFDNSNVNGTAGPSSASWGSQTSGSISGQSDWSRNSLSGSVGFSNERYFALPTDDHTDWNIGLGGGYTIGQGELLANYSHASYHELGTSIGTARSETPSLDTTDTGELGYTFTFGRFEVTPTLDLSAYRFGAVTQNGVSISQSQFDRNVVAGGVVTRYELTGAAGLLFVFRGEDSNFINPAPGQPSNNSNSVMVLTGLDYQAKSVWRYSLLVGVESRFFAAAQYGSSTGPIVSADVVYTPTGVLTVTGSLTRLFEDPDTGGTDGFALTQANVVVDYELLRNVLLQGRAGLQYAAYLQGGTQTSETVGGGLTWLLNRRVRLSLNDDFTNQTSPGGTTGTLNAESATSLSGAYTQNLLMLTLQLAL
jgi:hypothetical protein